MPKYNLLGVGNNAKTVKGDGSEYLTAIMYLAPADKVQGVNMCPMAIMAGCKKACLNTAGRGKFNNVQAARIRKTVLYRDNRRAFYDMLRADLTKFSSYCSKKGIQPVVRLNGTSDNWFIEIIRDYPEIQFYDYTKVYNRVYRELPDNYHLTISYSEANQDYALKVRQAAIETGTNMAVVFRDKSRIPKYFMGLPVIDGDKDDLRFLDPSNQPHVVALYAKGDAKKDNSGFVIDYNGGLNNG